MASSSEVKFVIEEVTALKDKITNVEKHLNQLNHSQRKSNSKNKQERKRTKKCILTQKGNVYKIAEKLKEIEVQIVIVKNIFMVVLKLLLKHNCF